MIYEVGYKVDDDKIESFAYFLKSNDMYSFVDKFLNENTDGIVTIDKISFEMCMDLFAAKVY